LRTLPFNASGYASSTTIITASYPWTGAIHIATGTCFRIQTLPIGSTARRTANYLPHNAPPLSAASKKFPFINRTGNTNITFIFACFALASFTAASRTADLASAVIIFGTTANPKIQAVAGKFALNDLNRTGLRFLMDSGYYLLGITFIAPKSYIILIFIRIKSD